MGTDQADATTLREAARILRARDPGKTLRMRVVVRVLEKVAHRIDHAAEWNAVTGRRG